MNIALLMKTPTTRIAMGALAVAVVVAGWTAVHALRADALPPTPPATIASLESITRHTARPMTDVQAAVENDLFSPDRTAPGGSYRMPGEAGPNDKPAAEAQKPLVLGTAVATDGRSFATLQLGDGHPTLVHVGDKIGEWVVRGIERGKVTLAGADGIRTAVTGPKPGAALDDNHENANNANQDDNEITNTRGGRGNFGQAGRRPARRPPGDPAADAGPKT